MHFPTDQKPENFFVHQMRSKTATKTFRSADTVTNDDTTEVTYHPMSEETMDKQLGAKRAAKLRELKIVTPDPCPYTGSMDPDLVIYKVPITLIRKTKNNRKRCFTHLSLA